MKDKDKDKDKRRMPPNCNDLYVVRIDTTMDAPYDAVYGYDPIIFSDGEEAEAKAQELSESGDWPDGQPTYHVERTTLDELEWSFPAALKRGIA